jgi:uncharacterized protein Usg
MLDDMEGPEWRCQRSSVRARPAQALGPAECCRKFVSTDYGAAAIFCSDDSANITQEEGTARLATQGGPMSNLSIQLRGYRLTTAEILYRLPDHPAMLQSFIWQDLDLAPRFPRLSKFLHFWETSLDGKLFSVRVASCGLISPSELALVGREFALH